MGLCFLNKIQHALVFSFGWIAFALGVVGIVLPLLPTTPFMLLAAGCFAKTSPKFHSWLLANKVFGALIKNWQAEKYIEPKSKARAMIVIVFTFAFSIWVVEFFYLRLMLVGLCIICLFFLNRISTVPISQRRSNM